MVPPAVLLSKVQPPLLAACHLPSEAVWRSGRELPEAEALPWGSAARLTVLTLWPACLEAVVSQLAETIPSPGRLLSGSDVARSTGGAMAVPHHPGTAPGGRRDAPRLSISMR